MRQDVQQTCIRERHRRLLSTEFQFVYTCLQIRTTDQIQPLLNVVLILEMSIFTRSFSQEENVQIELVKLSPLCNPLYRFRNLIGQHDHTRKRSIGIDIPSLCLIIREVRQMRPFFFATLLVRISPVINLFLNELTGVQRTERRARQIQVILRRNREPRFIIGIAGIVFRKVVFIRVFIRLE